MTTTNLLFLTGKLLNPSFQKDLRVPLTFIGFGFLKAKTYRFLLNADTFITIDGTTNQWGNKVAYGALFICNDFDFYSRLLDSYYTCSMSTLLRNHQNDIYHRVKVNVTPIYFNTLDEFQGLKYREGNEIEAQTYIANINHPKIIKRISDKKNTYRIQDGVDKDSFIKLFWEVTNAPVRN